MSLLEDLEAKAKDINIDEAKEWAEKNGKTIEEAKAHLLKKKDEEA